MYLCSLSRNHLAVKEPHYKQIQWIFIGWRYEVSILLQIRHSSPEYRTECSSAHLYRGQLNRFTTLSSPASHHLPPGLPAYVNPHIKRSKIWTRIYFTFLSGRQAIVFCWLFWQCLRSQEAVCLLWDYVTPCAKLPSDLCPTQNHLLLFKRSHLCSTISRQTFREALENPTDSYRIFMG